MITIIDNKSVILYIIIVYHANKTKLKVNQVNQAKVTYDLIIAIEYVSK